MPGCINNTPHKKSHNAKQCSNCYHYSHTTHAGNDACSRLAPELLHIVDEVTQEVAGKGVHALDS